MYKEELIMNATLSVQELWSQILALPAGDRHWLASKLYDYEEVHEEEEKPIEEINAWIDEFEADLEAGEPGYTLEELTPNTHPVGPKDETMVTAWR